MTANELLTVKQRFGIIGNTEALNKCDIHEHIAPRLVLNVPAVSAVSACRVLVVVVVLSTSLVVVVVVIEILVSLVIAVGITCLRSKEDARTQRVRSFSTKPWL